VYKYARNLAFVTPTISPSSVIVAYAAIVQTNRSGIFEGQVTHVICVVNSQFFKHVRDMFSTCLRFVCDLRKSVTGVFDQVFDRID
jgi:hypothetical protein